MELVAALSACAEFGGLEFVKWIHLYIDERLHVGNQPLLVSLNNSLIRMYASCGLIDKAYRVFIGRQHRNIVSWNTMITGFANQGYGEATLCVFWWIQSLGMNDTICYTITFIRVLCVCGHSGFFDQVHHFCFEFRIWGDPDLGGSHYIEVWLCLNLGVREIGQVPSEPKCLVDYLALLIQRFGRRAGDMKVPELQLVFSFDENLSFFCLLGKSAEDKKFLNYIKNSFHKLINK